MAGQARMLDMTLGTGSHGNLECPHVLIGFFIMGSPTVMVNNLSAVRAFTDFGVHSCPHCGINMPIGSSPNILMNGYPAHRLGDMVTEFCGVGITVIGSSNTMSNI